MLQGLYYLIALIINGMKNYYLSLILKIFNFLRSKKVLNYSVKVILKEVLIKKFLLLAQLRRNVTSPGGTTEQAINTFLEGGLPELVAAAANASKQRSIEISKELAS